jgi:hypothetical protein
MTPRHPMLSVLLPVLVLTTTVGCYRPFVPLKSYTRTEDFNLDHARWLHAHCDVVGISRMMDPTIGLLPGDRGNYMQLIGEDNDVFADGSVLVEKAAVVYACTEPTPWPREDGSLVRYYHQRGLDDAAAATRCTNAPYERRIAKFQVTEPGSGTTPTSESYVRYRVTPVVVIPATKAKEAEEYGITAGSRHSWVTANHVLCSDFREALLKLKPGGKAHVSSATYGRLMPDESVDMLEWDVELLELGSVDLLMQQVGLKQ